MPACLEWVETRTRECVEYRDNGYNDCAAWDARCCTWWPCNWLCTLVTWLCIAWFWVSHVVCVAWAYVSTFVCVLWDVVTTVVGAIIETVESVLGWALSALAFVVELIFSIPYVGRFLRWVWDTVLLIVWGAAALADGVLSALGIRPEKKLRVCTIVLSDENGTAVAQAANVVAALQNTINVFHEEANVRVLPSGAFTYSSGFASVPTAAADWVTVDGTPRSAAMLDVSCNAPAAGEDLGPVGTAFEFVGSRLCFYGNWRRVLGYGAPVIVYLVRSVAGPPPDGTLGCSLGPWAEYVTIEGANPICIAHELGHACNLWHAGDATNLMNNCGGTQLEWWQVSLFRMSRHVTFF